MITDMLDLLALDPVWRAILFAQVLILFAVSFGFLWATRDAVPKFLRWRQRSVVVNIEERRKQLQAAATSGGRR